MRGVKTFHMSTTHCQVVDPVAVNGSFVDPDDPNEDPGDHDYHEDDRPQEIRALVPGLDCWTDFRGFLFVSAGHH